MEKTKKMVIKDKVQLERIVENYLSNDLSLSLLDDYYDLTYPQREFVLRKSMAYSRQQEKLMDEYDRYEIAKEYLEMPHIVKEDDPLDSDEQKRLFQRLDEIDKEHVIKKMVVINDELSRVKTALKRINNKFGNEMKLCNLYKDKNPDCSLNSVLANNGFNDKKISLVMEMYESYCALKERKELLTEKRDELLKKRRELLDNNKEYSTIIDKLVTTNVKLANWVLRDFFRNIPLPKEEAQAIAFEGLGIAINRFDYTKGYNFSTYATKIISSQIKRYFKNLMGISWKNYCVKMNIGYWRNELASFDSTRKTRFTPEELANSGLVKYTVAQIRNSDTMIDGVYNFSDIYSDLEDMDVISKDMPMFQEDYDYLDAMDDQIVMPVDSEPIEREIFLPFLKETIYETIGELDDREQRILTLRFGLEDGVTRTLEEVGKEFFISRDRVRQIEAKALRKLRSASRRKRLLPFAEDFIMPRYYKPSASYDECVEAFMRLFELRSNNLSYRAKAFFISNERLEIDEEEAKLLDLLMDVFIINLSLDYSHRYAFTCLIDTFCANFGRDYEHKYPYIRVYDFLTNKLKEGGKKEFDEETTKLLSSSPKKVLSLALENFNVN